MPRLGPGILNGVSGFRIFGYNIHMQRLKENLILALVFVFIIPLWLALKWVGYGDMD